MKVNKHNTVYNSYDLKAFMQEHIGETFKINKVTSDFVELVQEIEQTEAEMHMESLHRLLECNVDITYLTEEEKAAIEYAIECIKTLDDMGILKGEQDND